MTAKEVNTALYHHFSNYDYKLNNTYMFNWESDFFAQSKSGYFIECEIKVSRGDFFVDFKKDKHLLFKDVLAGKSHHIFREEKTNRCDYDDKFPDTNLIAKVETAQLKTQYGFETGSRKYGKTVLWRGGMKNGKWGIWVNDYGRITLHKRQEEILAHFTRISIKPMEEIFLPNRFYYAVPVGLVKPDEVPKYAGLLYVKDGYIDQVKPAPFLHKRSMDLDRLLLKKYYNLWQFKVPHETKVAIRNNYSE